MDIFQKRKHLRIKGYNYCTPNIYFITICTNNRMNLFWQINNDNTTVGADIIRPQEPFKPQLSYIGNIVEKSINQIPEHYNNISVDKYCIMPNHIHMLLSIYSDEHGRMISAPTSISTIIGQMKRWVSKESKISLWQKSFYEHIIRNEQDYFTHCEYIENNPLKWETDDYYIK